MGLFAYHNDYVKVWKGKKDVQPVMPTKPEFDQIEVFTAELKDGPNPAPGKRQPPRYRRKPAVKRKPAAKPEQADS